MAETITITVIEEVEQVAVNVQQTVEQVTVTVTQLGQQGPPGPAGNLDPNATLDGGTIF